MREVQLNRHAKPALSRRTGARVAESPFPGCDVPFRIGRHIQVSLGIEHVSRTVVAVWVKAQLNVDSAARLKISVLSIPLMTIAFGSIG